MKRIRFLKILSIALLVAVTCLPFAQALADFNPNMLIQDSSFSDMQTFGSAAGIQLFLQSKNSPLANTTPAFLQMLREPTSVATKTGLEDPEPNLGRLRTAAELIWDVSQKTGINPQVVIVTLQKEQSLITGTMAGGSLQRALDHAMGFGCPDSGGCDQIFNGFYSQLFGGFDSAGDRYIGAAGSLMRSLQTPDGRGPAVDANNDVNGSPKVRTSKVGDTITIHNTLGGPQNPAESQQVTLQNAATSALYRYTPHVYNGNYNFWKFFDQWFHYPNGTLLKLASDNAVYIIQNGLKSAVPGFVAQEKHLNLGATVIVSPTELSNIDSGPMLGPDDNTIIHVATDPANKLYVFESNQKHPVSSFVLSQRGLKAANALSVAQTDADLFPTASLLTPTDGTLIKGTGSAAVYVIQNSQKMTLSAFTFKQYGYSFKNVVTLPQDEVDQYPGNGYVLPKNFTLVKSPNNPLVSQLIDGILHPVSGTVFVLRHYSFSNIATVSDNELAAASLGAFLPPPDGTYFLTSDGAVYQFNNNAKHYVSEFVFIQRAIHPVGLSLGEAAMMEDGDPVPPKDGTIIKGDQSAAIYVIQKGFKVALDFNTWVKTYKQKKPSVVSQAEMDSYPAPSQTDQ